MTHRNASCKLRALAVGALTLGALLASPVAWAEDVPGVTTLLQQGRYWQGKGQTELAKQAYRRALALDPTNSAARQGLSGANSTPPPPASPALHPAAAAPRHQPPAAAVPKAKAAQRPASPSAASGAARAAGFVALDADNLDLAAKQFQRAIAQNSQDADALGGMGLVRLKQQSFAKAREFLEKATRLGDATKWAPALAAAQYFAGLDEARALLAQGHLPQAQAQAEALARSDYADHTPALGLLADIYEREGRFADAADVFRQSGQGDLASQSRLQSRAARDTALQAAANGDAAGAEAAFQSGLMLDQSDPWIRYEFARFLLAQGRRPEAEALAATLASSIDPDGIYADALIYAALGHPDTADTMIGRIPAEKRTVQMRDFAIGLKTDIAVARSRQLAAQGRQAEALPALRALGATPHMPAAKLAEIADALADLGGGEAAASLAQRASAGEIREPAEYEPLIRVFLKTGHDAQAAVALQKATQLAGSSADGQKTVVRLNGIVAASRADKLRLAGQYASAFDVLQAAWTAMPDKDNGPDQDNGDILSALARLYQSGGKAPQAAQTFQMVLARSPQDKAALIGLIETAGAAGDVTLAHATIDQALTLSPNDYEIYLAAARMEQARGNKGAAVKYLKHARDLYNDAVGSGGGSGQLSPGNPFTNAGQGGNPFVQAQASPPQPVNPFALSDHIADTSTRIGAPGAFPPYAGHAGTAPFGTVGGAIGASVSTDPVLARIQSDIRTLSGDTAPRFDIQAGYRSRAGETGLSALKELTSSVQASVGLGGGRLSVKETLVGLDSGQPTGSALARIGRNATAEAQGIVAAEPSLLTNAATQQAAGVAVSLAYDSSLLQADVGSTPLGFQNTKITWHAGISPHFSPTTSARVWVENRPVTDSVLAYAGTRDPVSGVFWGQVMRMGGGASLSYDQDGTGAYGDASYYRYTGTGTLNNYGMQVNVGGYIPLWRGEKASLSGGLNLNSQRYANNQNFFTYGQGGYFSPQSFYAVSFPFRYTYTDDRLEIHANAAPGFQRFAQDQVPVYPTDVFAQAALNALKLKNTDVRSYYDSLSKTGIAISADGSLYYRLSPKTRVGGEVGINTFGSYTEFKSMFGIRQTFTGGQ